MNEIAPAHLIEADAEDLSGSHPLFANAPRSVAFNALPSRVKYWRLSRVSMVSARVAGVPSPLSFIAADSSLSSRLGQKRGQARQGLGQHRGYLATKSRMVK